MTDDKLAIDEAQRAANYEAIKSSVKADVGNEVATKAAVQSRADAVSTSVLAEDMRSRAVAEVAQTENEVQRGRFVARISQFVDYAFFLIYGLLIVRFLLELFAAREGNTFVQFLKSISGPFFSPFRGIVASPTTPEGFTLALPIVIAIVVYMLLHLAINGLLRIFAHRKVEV
jgi:YGGT family.